MSRFPGLGAIITSLWWLVLMAFVGLGLPGVRHAFIESPDAQVATLAKWGTSDSMLTSSATAYSSQDFIDALSDLPEGDLILFVANSGDVGFSLGYFHTCYFGAPRRTVPLRCDNPNHEARFFSPIPAGSVRIAAVVFYAMEPPPQFSEGRRIGPRLVVVPYSKLIAEITDWKYFCQ